MCLQTEVVSCVVVCLALFTIFLGYPVHSVLLDGGTALHVIHAALINPPNAFFVFVNLTDAGQK